MRNAAATAAPMQAAIRQRRRTRRTTTIRTASAPMTTASPKWVTAIISGSSQDRCKGATIFCAPWSIHSTAFTVDSPPEWGCRFRFGQSERSAPRRDSLCLGPDFVRVVPVLQDAHRLNSNKTLLDRLVQERQERLHLLRA